MRNTERELGKTLELFVTVIWAGIEGREWAKKTMDGRSEGAGGEESVRLYIMVLPHGEGEGDEKGDYGLKWGGLVESG